MVLVPGRRTVQRHALAVSDDLMDVARHPRSRENERERENECHNPEHAFNLNKLLADVNQLHLECQAPALSKRIVRLTK